MSDIDVVAGEKGKFKVLLDCVQRGISYSSRELANHEATKLHEQTPNTNLNLMK